MLTPFIAIVRAFDRVSAVGVIVAMAAMAALVSAQVFFRYVLSSSIDSADELSRLFFVWSIFLALPHGIRYGVHVGIDLLPMALPTRLQDILFRLMNLVTVVLMIVVAFVTYGVIVDKWSELMPTLPLTASLYYVPVLIASVHAALHMTLLAWSGQHLWKDETL
ncbi:TRAP transporter small permease [Fulvimarina sp. MAC8]|uniref:TRAP transporter small permease n=1 Tax=Fulvimarina sp. MAC8 TaxID=3162874 RepID=UPI0032F046A9